MERRTWAWIALTATSLGVGPVTSAAADDPTGWQVTDHSGDALPGVSASVLSAAAPATRRTATATRRTTTASVRAAPVVHAAAPLTPAATTTRATTTRATTTRPATTPTSAATSATAPSATSASAVPSTVEPDPGMAGAVLPPAVSADGDVDLDLTTAAGLGDPSWSSASSAARAARWTAVVASIASARAGRAGATYLRLQAPTGAPGQATAQPAAFRQAWQVYRDVVRRTFPRAKLVFAVDAGQDTPDGAAAYWPGDDAVDVVGVRARAASPSEAAVVESLTDPRGLAAWLGFAAAHGKPVGVPDWGPGTGAATVEGQTYLLWMQAALAANALTPGGPVAGRVAYAAQPPAPAAPATNPATTTTSPVARQASTSPQPPSVTSSGS